MYSRLNERNKNRIAVKRSNAGLGLFAITPFKRGEFIVEYAGPRLNNDEADAKGGKYLFAVSSRRTIDGSVRTNIARYANHACRPNCEAQINSRGRVFIVALRRIKPGEEITYDYGKEYTKAFIYKYGCRCKTCSL